MCYKCQFRAKLNTELAINSLDHFILFDYLGKLDSNLLQELCDKHFMTARELIL